MSSLPTIYPPVEASRTALLVYHLTEYHTDPRSSGFEPAVVDGLPAVNRLITRCRAAGMAIVFMVSETPRDDTVGEEVSKEIAPLPDETVIRQAPARGTSGGAFALPAFVDLLRERGVDTLLISGIAIDRGLNDTARRARSYGCRPIMVRDACFAQEIEESPVGPVSREDVERVHLAALYRTGVEIMTCDEVAAALS